MHQALARLSFQLAHIFLFSRLIFGYFMLIFMRSPRTKIVMGVLGVRVGEKTC